jgi:photosystem II stability/assembly factor-like uncharacterized protein
MPTDDRIEDHPGRRRPEDSNRLREAARSHPAAFLPDDKGLRVDVRPVRNPQPRASLGFVGVFADVKAEETCIPGTLVLRVEPRRLGAVAPESLRLFFWEAQAKLFTLVEPSGPGDGSYVWGRITTPGRYAVIGLNADPPVLATIRTLAAVRDLTNIGKEPGGALHLRICELVVCAPELGDEGKKRCVDCQKLSRPFELPEFELLPPVMQLVPERASRLGPSGEAGGRESAEPTRAAEEQARPASSGVLALALDSGELDRLYVGPSSGGLWCLDGVTGDPPPGWTAPTEQTGSLIVRAVAVAPANSQTLYVADGLGQIIRSVNRGATWSPPSEGRFRCVWRILVHPTQLDRLYVAAGSVAGDDGEGEMGLWESIDGGATWAPLRRGDVTDAALDPADASILYAAIRDEGLYRSTDSGQSWQLALPFVSEAVHGGSMIKVALGRQTAEIKRTVAVRFGQEIFVNRNGGRGPRQPGGGPWVSKGWRGGDGLGDRCQALAVDPFDDEVLIAGSQELVRTQTASLPGGGEWTTVASPSAPPENWQCVEFDLNHERAVYLANASGIFRSTDGGRTWTDFSGAW